MPRNYEKRRKLDRIEELFEELGEFSRIEIMQTLSQLRKEVPDRGDRGDGHIATIPAPEKLSSYGHGYVNLWLYVKSHREENLYSVVFSLTNVDDGSWTGTGPWEDMRDAYERQNEAKEIVEEYTESATPPEFEELKEQFQKIGIHLRI